jgi:hypothetical protein
MIFFRVVQPAMLALALFSFSSEVEALEPRPQATESIYWGTLGSEEEAPIYHPNGVLAWDGTSQESRYNEEHAFYHSNGGLAWGGVKQVRYSSGSGGLYEDGKFYHSNGELAWGGVKQVNYSGYSEGLYEDGRIYYSNGTLAWNGLKGAPVYNADGNKIARKADFVWLHLKEGSWLYADCESSFKFHFVIGEGYLISLSATEAYFNCYQHQIKCF